MVNIVEILLYIQTASVIVCLMYGSIVDIIKREISDIPWFIMFGEGLITSILIMIFGSSWKEYTLPIITNFITGLIIGILLLYTGIMGGADATALIALSANTALYPFQLTLTKLSIYRFVPTIFNIFFNWLLIMVLLYPIPLLVYNIYTKIRGLKLFDETKGNVLDKILAMISGYTILVEKAKNRVGIVYSEVYNENSQKWELKQFLQVADVDEEERFKRKVEEDIKNTSKKRIWVKILPPGIVFLLFGYIATLFIGNPLFSLLYSINN